MCSVISQLGSHGYFHLDERLAIDLWRAFLQSDLQVFTVRVLDPQQGCVIGTGQGMSKKEAAQQAAREGLGHYGLRL